MPRHRMKLCIACIVTTVIKKIFFHIIVLANLGKCSIKTFIDIHNKLDCLSLPA
jgi:hypothetical protein